MATRSNTPALGPVGPAAPPLGKALAHLRTTARPGPWRFPVSAARQRTTVDAEQLAAGDSTKFLYTDLTPSTALTREAAAASPPKPIRSTRRAGRFPPSHPLPGDTSYAAMARARGDNVKISPEADDEAQSMLDNDSGLLTPSTVAPWRAPPGTPASRPLSDGATFWWTPSTPFPQASLPPPLSSGAELESAEPWGAISPTTSRMSQTPPWTSWEGASFVPLPSSATRPHPWRDYNAGSGAASGSGSGPSTAAGFASDYSREPRGHGGSKIGRITQTTERDGGVSGECHEQRGHAHEHVDRKCARPNKDDANTPVPLMESTPVESTASPAHQCASVPHGHAPVSSKPATWNTRRFANTPKTTWRGPSAYPTGVLPARHEEHKHTPPLVLNGSLGLAADQTSHNVVAGFAVGQQSAKRQATSPPPLPSPPSCNPLPQLPHFRADRATKKV